MRFKPKIGVEIHAQLATEHKLFSSKINLINFAFTFKDAKIDWKAPINSKVAIFDSATPGTLPQLNSQCVKLAIRAARAINCKLSPWVIFDRKHYEHWDLPAGYQITQKRMPLGLDGTISINSTRKIRVKQIHLEQVNQKEIF